MANVANFQRIMGIRTDRSKMVVVEDDVILCENWIGAQWTNKSRANWVVKLDALHCPKPLQDIVIHKNIGVAILNLLLDDDLDEFVVPDLD